MAASNAASATESPKRVVSLENASKHKDVADEPMSEDEQGVGALTELLMSSAKLDNQSDNDIYEYVLQMDQTYCDRVAKVRKMEHRVGKGSSNAHEKVIMLVGENGSGKTTLINSMVNYNFGVSFKHDIRFRIIINQHEQNLSSTKTKSQTQWVTSYTFHHREGYRQPFKLTMIDTPGFGEGTEDDRMIAERIMAFLSSPGGIDHIDAVGFVVPSSVVRLTPTQRYIFDMIMSLFGKDIGNNIYIMITFADANPPPVLESLKQANIKYKMHIKFNNSAVFAKRKGQTDKMSEMFSNLCWEMGTKSFEGFFTHLKTLKPQSLTLTRDVLNEQQRLQSQLVSATKRTYEGLSKLYQLENDLNVINHHQGDIDRMKNFTYTLTEDRTVQVHILSGVSATNCLRCNRTCHYPCKCDILGDEGPGNCAAMTNGKCIRCGDAGCSWTVHKNVPYRLIVKQVEVTKTSDDLKDKYLDIEEKMMNAKGMAQRVYAEYLETKIDVLKLVTECKQCLKRMQEIAKKPGPSNEAECIGMWIETESRKRSDGYLERIEQLEDMRKLAKRLPMPSRDDLMKDKLKKENRVYTKFKELLED